MSYPLPLAKAIQALRRLPGVGLKTAERFAFRLLEWPDHQVQELANALAELPARIGSCPVCGALNDAAACHFCDEARKESGIICIVAWPRDVYAIDETGEYRGLYHVLHGTLSPMDGMTPDRLSIAKLQERIVADGIREAVIALDGTLEGDATALYLKEVLEPFNIKLSRLALGLPMGSSLDYVDSGTLARALTGRHNLLR